MKPTNKTFAGRYTGNIRFAKAVQPAPVLREELGEVLRAVRRRQNRTLREVSAEAQVSLGYLSEVERGQKEASSELLAAICKALGIPMALLLREVSDRIAVAEGLLVPDTVPDELVRERDRRAGVTASA